MSFYFLKRSRASDSTVGISSVENVSVDQKESKASEKESAAIVPVVEESKLEPAWKAMVNSKKECPHCKEKALSSYVDDYDDDGEARVSLMDCLNCGFKYMRDEKFEEEDKTGDDLDWSAAFILLVAMLLTIAVVRGNGDSGPLNESPTMSNQAETVQPAQRNRRTVDEAPVRVLNDAEPFEVGRDN